MKVLRSAKPLPRYTRRKPLAGVRWGYFFEPPSWARRAGCPVKAEALGEDYDAAIRRAEDVLLKAFDSWRTRGLSDMVPVGPTIGTFDWLVTIFKKVPLAALAPIAPAFRPNARAPAFAPNRNKTKKKLAKRRPAGSSGSICWRSARETCVPLR
jgi:hypothetical protein